MLGAALEETTGDAGFSGQGEVSDMTSTKAQPLPALDTNGKTVDLEELHALFIQNVSHELRTPLSILQGYAELLLGGDLGHMTPQQLQAVEIIVNRAQHLRTMVERIGVLLASRAHACVSVPLCLGGLVYELVEKRRAASGAAGLTLELDIEPDLPYIVGDPYQLQPALDCLLDNAIKFTPRGGRVTVKVNKEPGWICVAVIDTGIGFNEEEAELFFAPFYQADGSSTRRYGGLGLGLGLVRAVIAEHSGQIHVSSRPKRGSCFTVRLPTMALTSSAQGPPGGFPALRRILVVDDEENVALTIQDGLERLPGCQVAVSASGEEALSLFEQTPFDLLITDFRMPGTDGMTLAARVRQRYPHTAIIMITAYSSDLLYEQAKEHAIRRVLNKPVQLEEIRQVALEALEAGVT
jgi:CheY-like chemotaxis protein/anti-sigma regulatory factor (Ser/Thr protein kinase)